MGYLRQYAPPVCDPFCGGGSIPLEAQRLGLRAHGSDLNPVAVLVSKATCEIPPKFADRPPVNPERDPLGVWNGTQGLADDIHYYGRWMRDEAKRRIGHLYPKVEVTEAAARERADLRSHVDRELTVIAWLWARTVASPDPMVRGAHVPLVSPFVLSSRKGNEAIVVPVVDRGSGTYRFTVQSGEIDPDAVAHARKGTKAEGSAGFTCVISGAPISGDKIRVEGRAGRLGARLMAVVAEGKRGRIYLEPSGEMEETARAAKPTWKPDVEFFQQALGFRIGNYGMSKWSDLFTPRQLIALTTFSDLTPEVRGKILADALAAGMDAGATAASRLAEGGSGTEAYADAVATYLGLCVSRQANRCSNLSFWDPGGANVQQVFARQALPPVWDFCEANPFSDSTGNFIGQLGYLANVVAAAPSTRVKAQGAVIQQDAAGDTPLLSAAVIATDPPYYDNIGYADLSDFFYVWQRRALFDVWPDLFRRVLTPKEEELVATPHRHGGKDAAESFFMAGMSRALRNMHRSGADDFPVTLYYAFKQSEVAKEGLTSPGWATFLQGVVDAGYLIDGTWPVRTELAIALKKKSALASSIVLVCRKRSADAPVITRREFIARLRATLPLALRNIRAGGVGPVDMAQAAIGPGMGVFTTASKVLEPDDAPMTVRTAIALINQVRDEISGEETGGYDADTRFCIDWFETFGTDGGTAGDAITMAQAYDIGIDRLEAAGVFASSGGTARLLHRDELPIDWRAETDAHLTHWECAQHLARTLNAQDGGTVAAARLMAGMGADDASSARGLAYRLYDICERKGRADEAHVWNMLAREWPAIEADAQRFEADRSEEALELDLQGGR